MNDTRREFDLIVVGAGLAGMAATAFALQTGLEAAQVCSTVGELLFASGALDLLGIHPLEEQKRWEDPWAGIAVLIHDWPEHPYARLGLPAIRKAWTNFLSFLNSTGLHYRGWPERNAVLTTSAGTLKITYQVPQAMWAGVVGLKEKRATLIVDFEGMKDFSGVQLVETIGSQWPGLRSVRVQFPYTFRGGERQNIFMAEALRSPQVRKSLAEAILPCLKDAELVGVPAILGLRRPEMVIADLERLIGVPLFEIPTMPPSVPGLRLQDTIAERLRERGAVIMQERRVVEVNRTRHGRLRVVVRSGLSEEIMQARGVVLATGRFLGGGLAASRSGIRETILNLPVLQPQTRGDWHRPRFLDPQGHPVNQAGLEVDDLWRPLGSNGRCYHENLFAAGSLLAHQDWKRTKCGAGLAITTAYGAVSSFIDLIS
jgi:glycerol-3-phosphate dehydrogenase subunit B